MAKRSKELQRLEAVEVFSKVRLEANFRVSFEVFEAARLAGVNCSLHFAKAATRAIS